MIASKAQIAWLCLPPGPHVPVIVAAVISAGLDVIVEKPWLSSVAETEPLIAQARASSRILAIHYEYCYLEEVQDWRRRFKGGAGLQFGGRFAHSRLDHLGISALDNLGSHLLAIREYAVPRSQLGEIHCGYDLPDERCVWLEEEERQISSIDLLASKEPVIERFIAAVEAALEDGAVPLDLDFALRVASAVDSLKRNVS
ncbi:MAG: Gfo/Idh/MocA family oxidoreductase [Terriglobales bacterium]